VRYGEAVIKKAQERKMNVAFFDRMKAPDSIEETEGKSLDFLVDRVMKKIKRPPDIIYDKGAVGKEPMIRLFAKDPVELIQKMEMIRP
jgi:hydroxymethylpyrimidine/phosphomethylpyrimidine kinase